MRLHNKFTLPLDFFPHMCDLGLEIIHQLLSLDCNCFGFGRKVSFVVEEGHVAAVDNLGRHRTIGAYVGE